MLAQVNDLESEQTSIGYGVVAGLLQSHKQKGAVEAASSIAAYSHNGESKIKSEVLSATLEDWAMAIHHTWIDSIDKNSFIAALKSVNKFKTPKILEHVSRYFLEFKLEIHAEDLPDQAQLTKHSGKNNDAFIIHAFSNPIKEEKLDDALTSSEKFSMHCCDSTGQSIKANNLNTFENQNMNFECVAGDGRSINIKQVTLVLLSVKGEALTNVLTAPVISMSGNRFDSHVLQSVKGCSLALTLDFCMGSDHEVYSLSLEG